MHEIGKTTQADVSCGNGVVMEEAVHKVTVRLVHKESLVHGADVLNVITF